jgi:hypothetical protein
VSSRATAAALRLAASAFASRHTLSPIDRPVRRSMHSIATQNPSLSVR